VNPTETKPIRFSASKLKTWSNCPLAGYFKYVELVREPQSAKASYGSILHDALRHYNLTGDIAAAKTLFRDHWKNPEKVGLAPDWWPKGATFAGLLEQGVRVLERYHDSLKWDERTVVGVEHPFLVPFGDYELVGYVDLIELRKTGNGRRILKVVDYKGGNWAPKTVELLYDIQFTVYLYAVDQPEFWVGNGTAEFPGVPFGERLFEELETVPRRAVWYHLNSLKEIDAGARKDEDYARLYRLCREAVKAQEARVFVPRIGDACSLCGYTKECGIDPKVHDEDKDDRWF
jgi:PD-(D/E)XK nuclease superfamily